MLPVIRTRLDIHSAFAVVDIARGPAPKVYSNGVMLG
jgi:hypothetical protein